MSARNEKAVLGDAICSGAKRQGCLVGAGDAIMSFFNLVTKKDLAATRKDLEVAVQSLEQKLTIEIERMANRTIYVHCCPDFRQHA
jgi:hypothetical protein